MCVLLIAAHRFKNCRRDRVALDDTHITYISTIGCYRHDCGDSWRLIRSRDFLVSGFFVIFVNMWITIDDMPKKDQLIWWWEYTNHNRAMMSDKQYDKIVQTNESR